MKDKIIVIEIFKGTKELKELIKDLLTNTKGEILNAKSKY